MTMALPNSIPLFTIPKVFFTPYFDNAIATIVKNLYLYFGNAISANFFFFLIATIANFLFFFPIIWFSLHTLTLRASTQAAGMGRRNCGNTIAKNKKFLSYFLSFSLQLLLNFCNGIAAIHSLSSEC